MDRRALVFVAAVPITVGILALALGLGSWAFGHRRATLHHGRLQRLTEQHPARTRVEAGILAEGGRLVDQASSSAELRVVAARWAPGSENAVITTGSRFRTTRVALVGGMVYFLFFDDKDELRDFAVMPAGS
jgi:hypothetical protein